MMVFILSFVVFLGFFSKPEIFSLFWNIFLEILGFSCGKMGAGFIKLSELTLKIGGFLEKISEASSVSKVDLKKKNQDNEQDKKGA